LELGGKLRDVKAFRNADELFTQIETDILGARKYFMRRRIRAEWKTLSLSDQANLAEMAVKHLSANLRFLEAKTVYLYAPLLGKEITFVSSLMKLYPDKTYAFPRIENKTMKFYVETDFKSLKTGAFGILAPVSEVELVPTCDDLMIVPAVAADETGTRLGQGGGFYDKYLEGLKSEITTLVVLPRFAIVEKVPTEKHDQSVDKVIAC
jgi:5-formyltetrahydrofolate cyclo-ligase